ncbi:MAG: hypothetical protein AVDCRST_MAG68-3512, partial [uncultured Gemmatimonadetes bacterium]
DAHPGLALRHLGPIPQVGAAGPARGVDPRRHRLAAAPVRAAGALHRSRDRRRSGRRRDGRRRRGCRGRARLLVPGPPASQGADRRTLPDRDRHGRRLPGCTRPPGPVRGSRCPALLRQPARRRQLCGLRADLRNHNRPQLVHRPRLARRRHIDPPPPQAVRRGVSPCPHAAAEVAQRHGGTEI